MGDLFFLKSNYKTLLRSLYESIDMASTMEMIRNILESVLDGVVKAMDRKSGGRIGREECEVEEDTSRPSKRRRRGESVTGVSDQAGEVGGQLMDRGAEERGGHQALEVHRWLNVVIVRRNNCVCIEKQNII